MIPTIPGPITIREGHILSLPETPAQTAERRRQLAAIEPDQAQLFHAQMQAKIEAARLARVGRRP